MIRANMSISSIWKTWKVRKRGVAFLAISDKGTTLVLLADTVDDVTTPLGHPQQRGPLQLLDPG